MAARISNEQEKRKNLLGRGWTQIEINYRYHVKYLTTAAFGSYGVLRWTRIETREKLGHG